MGGTAAGTGYMLYHSIGQYPGKAQDLAQAMADFAAAWGRIEGGQWDYAFAMIGRYVARWQALIGAAPGTITPTENVTAAVSALVNALPDKVLRGRSVLVSEDCFPSNHFLLTGLSERLGFTLHTVKLRQGASWVEDEDIIRQWTEDVGLALITWVSSVSSHRSDLAALVGHGRKMGSVIGVDITQAAGLLPFDVTAPPVDFAVSTSLKWTCGTPGAGMLYAAPALISRCAPVLRGWFSQPDPFNWDITRFSYAPDIRRFDHGTPGVIACAATLPALDWHAAQDHAALRAHNLALCQTLQEGVQALGLPLASPTDPARRGGSIMVKLPRAGAMPGLLQALAAADVQADGRGAVLRLSPGVLTTESGVGRALATLQTLTLRQ